MSVPDRGGPVPAAPSEPAAPPEPGLPAPTGILRVGAGTSLTRQVLEAMLSAIQRGAFASGRLPPEDELARQLAVSRTTVRRALQSMEQIGLIERRPGRGTRLRVHNGANLLALHGLVPFPTLLRELGHDVSSHVTWRRFDVAPEELSSRLGRETDGGSYE
ncbi:MAG: GntR family transcriptional regulator, partial [Solirubrobacteraceae bacterium]